MGRQLRKVAANWQHPKNEKGHYIPLLEHSFSKSLAEWEEGKRQWDLGFRKNWFAKDNEPKWIEKDAEQSNMSWEEWTSSKPIIEDYMPEWTDEEKTHIQLYENTSEGTPISPVFKSDEIDELCEYAAENCSTFANYKASKEEWKNMLDKDFVHHTQWNVTFI